MDIKDVVRPLVRMMERMQTVTETDQIGNLEALEHLRLKRIAREHRAHPRVKSLLDILELQAQRERGELHLSAQATTAMWEKELEAAKEFLEKQSADKDVLRTGVLSE